MYLSIPRRKAKLLPTTILTPEDWIAEVDSIDSQGYREALTIGVSHWLTEAQAVAHVNRTLNFKGVVAASIEMRRRWQRSIDPTPTDPERLAAYDKEAV